MKNSSFIYKHQKEKKAIEKIKTNPKYFYSFAKKKAKTKQKISQLPNDDLKVITERKEIADTLQNQFCSSFSSPTNPIKLIPSLHTPPVSLSDITFSTEDFIKAIDEIDANSSCPDFSTPAIVLKKCKKSLCKPLYLMWKESFSTGVVPACYKQQLITPVYKKGSRSTPSNYRPISLTPHEIKIFERILRSKLMEFLEDNNMLSCKQHGFRKNKSCLSQLLQQYDTILNNLLDQNETDVIYLDFAKAFDKVDHQILLRKLENMGIKGKLLEWLKSFLSDRNQVVVVDGVLSFIALVISGVPQGTVLGPLLFLVYLNDIYDCLQFSELSSFADDSRIFKSISVADDSQFLQQDLFNVSSWSDNNNMQLHNDKFIYMNFNCRPANFSLATLPFYSENFRYETSSGDILEPSDSVSDLGITLADKFSWSPHVSILVKKAKQKAGWVLSIFKDRSPLVMKTLHKSLIRSLLEYGCPLWNGLSLENIRNIEAVQRSFTNKIYCPSHVKNYWERLQFLNIMSLQRRRERYVILHMFKILNNLASNDINISFYDSPRHGILARVPALRLHCSTAQSLYDYSFAVNGPKLWNLVPKKVKDCVSLTSFKSNLDDFLKDIPDCPPISGYVAQNNNSLLEWRDAGTLRSL